jgi:zinc transporter 1/2/3
MEYKRRRISPLQAKGMFTLCLLLVADTVTFSNAAKLYQNPEKLKDSGGFSSKSSQANGECPIAGTCSNRAPVVAPVRTSLGRLTKRFNLGGRCPDCCSSETVQQCLSTRGGHSTASMVAEAATGAAAAEASAQVLPYGIPLNGWKVIFQAILTTINVLCWLIPLRSKKISENKLALSLANAFSGGVFLSLAFGHLIPECVHGFAGYNEVTPYLLVLTGYLLIFFVEKVAFDPHDILHEMEHAHANEEKKKVTTKKNKGKGKQENVVADVQATSGRSAVILLAALAVHSILEMAALGLADTFGDCAILSLSIALHQPAESIALLVAFLKSGMPKPQIVRFLSIFSAMGPIGVALGMAVNEFAAPIVDAVMVAIVAGTFVYVGATEVIPEEWEDSEHKWKKFLALMSGIVSILVITQYTMSLEF